LVAGDYFKRKPELIELADQAMQVFKWFNNHSHALGILCAEQKLTEERVVTLILPVITCWTSHYLAMQRLLEVSKSMRSCVIKKGDALLVCAGPKADAKQKAQQILSIVMDTMFWENVTRYCIWLAAINMLCSFY
jgi:hypothetical protein